MRDDIRRMALFGSGVAELTRHRAEQLARDLVERSKANRDEILKLIRGEIQNQIASIGVATKRDLERLERRVTRLETQLKDAGRTRAPASTPPKATQVGQQTTGSKTAAKSTRKKTSAAKSTGTRSATKPTGTPS